MSDSDAPEADASQRLEAALERIAQNTPPAPPAMQAIDTGVVAARLDRLIGHLRDVLSDDTAAEA